MTPEFPSKMSMQSKLRCICPVRVVRIVAATAIALLLLSCPGPVAFAQATTLLVLRNMPVKSKKGETFKTLPAIVQSDIAEIKIGGKPATITAFTPLLKGPSVLQIMFLLDSSERIGINDQFDDIKKLFTSLPSNVEIGVGYLLQGKAKIVQPFTTDRTLAGNALRLPTEEEAASPKNDNGNPFQCLRDLAAHWPGADPAKLRAVVMFTDGIIRSNGSPQSGDQLNPDVDGASQSLQRAGIVPYPFYYMDPIPPQNRSSGGQLEGQQNFSQLDADTGGGGLYEGQFAPSSFAPLLDQFYRMLDSEAVVTVTVPGSGFKHLDIKSSRDDIKVLGPDSVTIGNAVPKK